MTRWDGDDYQSRFDRLAAAGTDVHGEATFVADLRPATVLDAGCGTGRVAIELARRGIAVVGVDVDASMLATARTLAPELTWIEHDLAALDLGRTFDVVVMAGNVLVFCEPDQRGAAVASCAAHLRHGGLLIAGFTLAAAVGPTPVSPMVLRSYDAWCSSAGLELVERFATWERAPYDGGDYAVSVHRAI